MVTEDLALRRLVVAGSGIIYWLGVFINAARVRRKIGRTPNLRPRGLKEKLLWAGWFLVIALWIIQPFLLHTVQVLHQLAPTLGICLICVAYAATLWTYSSMGASWRIGVDRHEKTELVIHGPFRWVRHPIYLFQIMMLGGVFLLLPTELSLLILVIHFVCVLVKVRDEESYLEGLYGEEYRSYKTRTGRLLPKMKI